MQATTLAMVIRTSNSPKQLASPVADAFRRALEAKIAKEKRNAN